MVSLVSSIARAATALPLVLRESQLDPLIRDSYGHAAATGIPYPFTVEEFQRLFETAYVIHRCASLNATAVASGKLVFRRASSRAGGDEDLPENHPLVRLFSFVNPRQTLHDLIEMSSLYLDLTGNCYWELARVSETAPVMELYTLQSARVRVVPGSTRVGGYIYEVNGRRKELAPGFVFHILYPDPSSDWYGISPARAAAKLIDADLSQQRAEKALWENRSQPSAIAALEPNMSKAQLDYIKNQWDERHKGPMNAGKMAFMSGVKDLFFLQLSPAEMQALERSRFTKRELMQLYGVYPVIYGDVDESATRENATTQEIQYHERTVLPRARRVEDALTERFIPTCGIKGLERVYAHIDYSDTTLAKQLRADQARANAPMLDRGVLTINDVAEELGYEDKPWGDTWYGPLSTQPIAGPGATPEREPAE